MTFEELCAYIEKSGIEYTTGFDGDEYEEENCILILSCSIGDNFYDYGDDAPENLDFSYIDNLELREIIENDPRVYIKTCEDCCGCAGW